ncbi:MAG: hypothetical protein ACYC28_05960 [Longimicrobiales bacterium]
MTFFRSLLMLAGAISLLLTPYSFGHAISNHNTKPVIVGLIALTVLLALTFFLTRRRGSSEAPSH